MAPKLLGEESERLGKRDVLENEYESSTPPVGEQLMQGPRLGRRGRSHRVHQLRVVRRFYGRSDVLVYSREDPSDRAFRVSLVFAFLVHPLNHGVGPPRDLFV